MSQDPHIFVREEGEHRPPYQKRACAQTVCFVLIKEGLSPGVRDTKRVGRMDTSPTTFTNRRLRKTTKLKKKNDMNGWAQLSTFRTRRTGKFRLRYETYGKIDPGNVNTRFDIGGGYYPSLFQIRNPYQHDPTLEYRPGNQ